MFMKDKDRPSRITGWLNGVVYVLFAVLAAAIVISMNFEAGVLQAFFLVFVAAVGAMTLWLKWQLSTLPETGDEVQRAGAEVAALLEGARAVLRYREFEPTARAIFDICKELTGATAGYVALMSADGTENEVLFLDAGGRACHVNPDLPMPIRGLRGEAYAKGKAVYENDFGNSPWIKYIPPDHVKLDNILFAPLILEEKVVGVNGLANKPGPFNDDDARLAAAFGEIASIGLANSRMLESLEQSESRFRGMYDSNMIGIAFCKQAGEVTDANDAFLEMVGYTRQDVREGKVNWVEMTPPEYEHLRQKGVEEANAKGYCTPFEKEYIRKDGTRVPILIGGALLKGEEDVGVAYAIDMTERKRAEAEIANLAKFPSENPNPVLRISNEGVILYANQASKDVLETWDCKEGEKLPAECYKRIEASVESGGASEFEFECSNARIFSATLSPVADGGYVNVYGLDITERKEAEEKIESLAKFPAENPNPVLRIRRDGAIV